jgi:hypothetical protein
MPASARNHPILGPGTTPFPGAAWNTDRTVLSRFETWNLGHRCHSVVHIHTQETKQFRTSMFLLLCASY